MKYYYHKTYWKNLIILILGTVFNAPPWQMRTYKIRKKMMEEYKYFVDESEYNPND